LAVFSRLKNKGLVHSRQGRPYRISMAGLKAVRPQADNRCPPSFSIAPAGTRRGFRGVLA
ncbi:TPA: hypothetical protein L4G10_006838, partial [Pseudomonas aeruginosa]|nr:hypothetical protein [Pseudomonas aeruginosa]